MQWLGDDVKMADKSSQGVAQLILILFLSLAWCQLLDIESDGPSVLS